ncbi:uncharacterized protein MONBRDRAFT_12377 [Monosiga brevicollis MX1]|uniref:Uncharacterized protein n=1 Tax=Monosiga brevicollis TaxID=81824 RepID=A9VC32_MONBE|nr:uncharacterized protein MONBRDRAFT_12377 [Monosiga brevicollis MX1]EDQ84910.1 predicted protein [Monosiga brevicollis MX1]|eukprot:XP_001750251.1 hypothetical protein [Monosiga brevicollis MX1]
MSRRFDREVQQLQLLRPGEQAKVAKQTSRELKAQDDATQDEPSAHCYRNEEFWNTDKLCCGAKRRTFCYKITGSIDGVRVATFVTAALVIMMRPALLALETKGITLFAFRTWNSVRIAIRTSKIANNVEKARVATFMIAALMMVVWPHLFAFEA